ncbi:F0F1 ATP synthase subunit delta [Mycoplasma sp. ATU-Cv-703]|uniref:F0F1 ATP synthase subunit delta n=1 Tax=Mycoplasma sp. ATU-Cv-703 TaxID=2498595 RepID=UPI000FDEF7E0
MDSTQSIGYALALFQLAQKARKTALLKKQAAELAEVFRTYPTLASALDSYQLSTRQKTQFIEKALTRKFDRWLINLMLILAERKNAYLASKILSHFGELASQALGVQSGVLYSSEKLTPQQITRISTKISRQMKKPVELVNKIDQELIGGVKVVIEDQAIDDSINARLEALRERLTLKGILQDGN